jgi:hypothetical protein
MKSSFDIAPQFQTAPLATQSLSSMSSAPLKPQTQPGTFNHYLYLEIILE